MSQVHRAISLVLMMAAPTALSLGCPLDAKTISLEAAGSRGAATATGEGTQAGDGAPSCSDGIKNGEETGVDCGESCATLCDSNHGEPCMSDAQCTGGSCGGGLCRLSEGSPCDEDAECATILCKNKKCTACALDSDCKTECVDGICRVEGGAPCGDSEAACSAGQCINHLCGVPMGQKCVQHTDCSSHLCSTQGCVSCVVGIQCQVLGLGECNSGHCSLPDGAYCNPEASECLPGKACAGFPPKCQ
jgi:hypothetical protein